MIKYLLMDIYAEYCQRYTLTTQIWRMHLSVAVGATSRKLSLLGISLWGLGSNVKLPYRFKAFHYEGKCETTHPCYNYL